MSPRPTPHDFLLRLRNRHPFLARRLDGIRGLAREGGALRVSVPEGSWSHRELEGCQEDIAAAAETFFGEPLALELHVGSGDPEALPFAVAASKVWNHAVFWTWEGARSAVLAVRKTTYAERWIPAARASGEEGLAVRLAAQGEAFVRTYAVPDDGVEWILPSILEDLFGLARETMSYAQLVAAFPGDEEADRLEARLYAVKEWGTPAVPAPLLHKYVGRVHYACPRALPLGLRLARQAMRAGG